MGVHVETTAGEVEDFNLFDAGFVQNWRELCAEWATRPPFFVSNFGVRQAVICRYADVKHVLMSPKEFGSKPPEESHAAFDAFMGLPHLAAMDGAAHDRVRRLLQPWFGKGGLAQHHPAIDRAIADLLDELEAAGPEVDLVTQFGRELIPRIMLGGMFGIEAERREVFITMNRELEDVFKVGGYPEAYVATFNRACDVVAEMIAEREATPREDFIGGLVAGRQSGAEPVTNEEIVANVFAICAAAMTTTATETTMTLLEWVRNRDQFEALKDTPTLVHDAVEESMRLNPAGIFVFPRFALEDVEINGTHIPAGTPVHVCVAAADLDPDQYPDPLRFDLGRKPKHILVFGHGTHFCAGSILARAIVAASLTAFMERFPDMELASPDFQPEYGGQLGETAPRHMPVRLR